MIKKTLTFAILIIQGVLVFACPVCERNKPKVFQNITHGSSPQDSFDYIIVISMVVVVMLTLFYSVKWIIAPKENDKNHIKYTFLNNK